MKKTNASILVIDDQEDILFASKMLLKKHFENIFTLNNPKNVVDLLAKNLCGCKKKETKKGCCKTEHKLVKLEDNHKASAAHFACDVPVAILPTTTHNFNSILNYNNTITAFNSLPPPTLSQEAIYKRNCVFRI